jgi:hypothetical protein
MSASDLTVTDSTWTSGRYFAALLSTSTLNNVNIISTDSQCIWHRATRNPVVYRNIKITNKSGVAFLADTYGNTALNDKNMFIYNFDISECPSSVAANINNLLAHAPYTIEMSFGFSVLSQIIDEEGNDLDYSTAKFYDKDDSLVATYIQDPSTEREATDIIVLTAKHAAGGGIVNYVFDTPTTSWTNYLPIRVVVEKAGYETYEEILMSEFSRDDEVIKKGLVLKIALKKIKNINRLS